MNALRLVMSVLGLAHLGTAWSMCGWVGALLVLGMYFVGYTLGFSEDADQLAELRAEHERALEVLMMFTEAEKQNREMN